MYVYVDVLLCVNVIMNTILLIITAWLARISFAWWRVILAACLGALYVIGGALLEFAIFYTPIFKLFVSFSLIFIAFEFKTWRAFLLQIAVFYITSFILGGAVLGWLFFWCSGNPFSQLGKEISTSWILLTGGIFVCFALLSIVTKFVLNRMLRQRTLYQTEAKYNDKSVVFTAMLDTGNALYTILGRRPVVLVNQTTIEQLMDDCVAKFLKDCPSEQWFENLEACGDDAWLSRVQIIPYQSVGINNLLLGFRPDILVIKTERGIIETDNVVLGLYRGELAKNNMYQALLHPAILKA
ncbi:MAG: sigma-E processing peptidase SpoIIGA [Veillonellaceae bacterium]|jgi:stage II sporulation protein GA (sporulation sigma-E factor processing peptidase)|nr:sigma-E processing peptidase SpoIIGA [Veillonellaceae bacterium]